MSDVTGSDAAADPMPAAEASDLPASPPAAPARTRAAHVVPGGSGPSGPGVPSFVTAVHARDAAAARAALSPQFAGKANGRPLDADAQLHILDSFWAGFPDGNFAMEATGGSGRYVIAWTFAGTHGGMYLGIPPTGAAAKFDGYIIAVADNTGVRSLEWKWDTKAFTRLVLGNEPIPDLEMPAPKHRPDPSRRWSHGPGPGQGNRRKPKGGSDPRQRQGGQAPGRGGPNRQAPPMDTPATDAPAPEGTDGAPPAQTSSPGQPGQPGQEGRRGRRRRGQGPGRQGGGAPADTPTATGTEPPAAPAPDAAAAPAPPTHTDPGQA